MPPIHPSDRLGDLATRLPAAARVFHRRGIDFSCGGARSLRVACGKAQVDLLALVAEIEEEVSDADAAEPNWGERPLEELIDHIRERFHAPLRLELSRLAAMAAKVAAVHGTRDPARLSRLAALLSELREELLQHMRKEEEVLFPWIRSGSGGLAGAPITTLQREHETFAVALLEIASLTDRFSAPPEACDTWRGLYLALAALDLELSAHMHLENNVLFPRALAE